MHASSHIFLSFIHSSLHDITSIQISQFVAVLGIIVLPFLSFLAADRGWKGAQRCRGEMSVAVSGMAIIFSVRFFFSSFLLLHAWVSFILCSLLSLRVRCWHDGHAMVNIVSGALCPYVLAGLLQERPEERRWTVETAAEVREGQNRRPGKDSGGAEGSIIVHGSRQQQQQGLGSPSSQEMKGREEEMMCRPVRGYGFCCSVRFFFLSLALLYPSIHP